MELHIVNIFNVMKYMYDERIKGRFRCTDVLYIMKCTYRVYFLYWDPT